MIKASVILDNKIWKKDIKNPKFFFNKKLKLLSNLYFFKKKNHQFTILLTTNKIIKKLNNKFRKKNKTTDVLSFPFNEKIKKNSFLGDIVISYEIVKKRSYNSNFVKELDKLWIHGLLHLLGYNHKKLKDHSKMYSKEKKILKHFEAKN